MLAAFEREMEKDGILFRKKCHAPLAEPKGRLRVLLGPFAGGAHGRRVL